SDVCSSDFDDVSHTKVNTEWIFGVLDSCHQGSTDSSVFLYNGDWSNTRNFKCNKIITCRRGDDIFQHFFQLLRGIWNSPEQEIYIHSHSTIKVSNRIDKQPAFQDKIFGILGFLQATQEFFLAKELQAQLIASPLSLLLFFRRASTETAISAIQ